ncbi:hypothetical protein EV356DRAFT_550435 [Viridothelium virens]|uniref:Uncharacterized protein n=1 Tax=Viridothelium virens TaxID=1048519 RepID=A0A6A6HKC1_VIRVR|nr:hypothetical protein EV356DRAFT_550435 [Viridothelium virens]
MCSPTSKIKRLALVLAFVDETRSGAKQDCHNLRFTNGPRVDTKVPQSHFASPSRCEQYQEDDLPTNLRLSVERPSLQPLPLTTAAMQDKKRHQRIDSDTHNVGRTQAKQSGIRLDWSILRLLFTNRIQVGRVKKKLRMAYPKLCHHRSTFRWQSQWEKPERQSLVEYRDAANSEPLQSHTLSPKEGTGYPNIEQLALKPQSKLAAVLEDSTPTARYEGHTVNIEWCIEEANSLARRLAWLANTLTAGLNQGQEIRQRSMITTKP